MLLIVGGSKDHNITRLTDAARARGMDYRVILTDAVPAAQVSWQPGDPLLTINGETFGPDNTSLFIRYDVFGDQSGEQRAAYFDAIKGWADAHPSVGIFNRRNETMEMSKPRALVLVKDCGFAIPETHITSDFNAFAARDAYIAKPVSGGAYTRVLSDMHDAEGHPWIVQEKLDYPELHLFRVGAHYFAFEIDSKVIDYRIDPDFAMREVTPPPHLVAAMEKLSDKLGLDYSAADFKTDPKTGELRFLEINTMPMFTGYDDCARGRLSDAMCLVLKKLSVPGPIKAAKPAF